MALFLQDFSEGVLRLTMKFRSILDQSYPVFVCIQP